LFIDNLSGLQKKSVFTSIVDSGKPMNIRNILQCDTVAKSPLIALETRAAKNKNFPTIPIILRSDKMSAIQNVQVGNKITFRYNEKNRVGTVESLGETKNRQWLKIAFTSQNLKNGKLEQQYRTCYFDGITNLKIW
jgi:hypothetical protein